MSRLEWHKYPLNDNCCITILWFQKPQIPSNLWSYFHPQFRRMRTPLARCDPAKGEKQTFGIREQVRGESPPIEIKGNVPTFYCRDNSPKPPKTPACTGIVERIFFLYQPSNLSFDLNAGLRGCVFADTHPKVPVIRIFSVA